TRPGSRAAEAAPHPRTLPRRTNSVIGLRSRRCPIVKTPPENTPDCVRPAPAAVVRRTAPRPVAIEEPLGIRRGRVSRTQCAPPLTLTRTTPLTPATLAALPPPGRDSRLAAAQPAGSRANTRPG